MTVASTTDEIQRVAADGAKRLLARASDSRSLKPEQLAPRIARHPTERNQCVHRWNAG